jgi:hypothetical protein
MAWLKTARSSASARLTVADFQPASSILLVKR